MANNQRRIVLGTKKYVCSVVNDIAVLYICVMHYHIYNQERNILKLINKFEICSGPKLNLSKTEALWMGKDKNKAEKPFNIK